MDRNSRAQSVVVLRAVAATLVISGWTLTAGAQTITEFNVPEPNAPGVVLGITAGPDGALWFPISDAIGRVTISGVFTYFIPTPTLITNGGITTGPDGALWFTGAGAGNVSKMDGSRLPEP